MEVFPLKPCKTVGQAARYGRLDELKRLTSKGFLILILLRIVLPVCYSRQALVRNVLHRCLQSLLLFTSKSSIFTYHNNHMCHQIYFYNTLLNMLQVCLPAFISGHYSGPNWQLWSFVLMSLKDESVMPWQIDLMNHKLKCDQGCQRVPDCPLPVLLTGQKKREWKPV